MRGPGRTLYRQLRLLQRHSRLVRMPGRLLQRSEMNMRTLITPLFAIAGVVSVWTASCVPHRGSDDGQESGENAAVVAEPGSSAGPATVTAPPAPAPPAWQSGKQYDY